MRRLAYLQRYSHRVQRVNGIHPKFLHTNRHVHFGSPEDLFNEELVPLGLSVEELKKHPAGVIRRFEPEEVYKNYENEEFATPTGKVKDIEMKVD